MSTSTFQINKHKLDDTRWVEAPDPALADGQVRVQVNSFAFTANNITYAAFGDAMKYWQFYPATDESGAPAPDWGCIPVWGFATVLQSLHPGVAVGERLWGYWPMASKAVLSPTRLSPAGFTERAPQRAELAAVYNQVSRCNSDAFYTQDSESLQALLRPLYLTAWLIDDFMADNAFFGTVNQADGKPLMLLSSASSKTAWSTAALLCKRSDVEVVGLTSAANKAYCESLGCYARVLGYDELDSLPANAPCIYVDFAGNAGLREAIHKQFSRLAYSCSIGGTHVQALGTPGAAQQLPGPRPKLFFAPAQSKKRSVDWGAKVFTDRLAASWHGFQAQLAQAQPPWLQVQQHSGQAAVEKAYALVLGGQGDAQVGHMLSI